MHRATALLYLEFANVFAKRCLKSIKRFLILTNHAAQREDARHRGAGPTAGPLERAAHGVGSAEIKVASRQSKDSIVFLLIILATLSSPLLLAQALIELDEIVLFILIPAVFVAALATLWGCWLAIAECPRLSIIVGFASLGVIGILLFPLVFLAVPFGIMVAITALVIRAITSGLGLRWHLAPPEQRGIENATFSAQSLATIVGFAFVYLCAAIYLEANWFHRTYPLDYLPTAIFLGPLWLSPLGLIVIFAILRNGSLNRQAMQGIALVIPLILVSIYFGLATQVSLVLVAVYGAAVAFPLLWLRARGYRLVSGPQPLSGTNDETCEPAPLE